MKKIVETTNFNEKKQKLKKYKGIEKTQPSKTSLKKGLATK